MKEIRKLAIRRTGLRFAPLKEGVGRDPNLVAEFGEIEGDSLDMVEATMAIEKTFGSHLKKKSSS